MILNSLFLADLSQMINEIQQKYDARSANSVLIHQFLSALPD